MSSYSESDYHYLFKLLLIGDSGCGKSCLLLRYSEDSYRENFISTIGVDFKISSEEIDSKRIKLQIWDTAGQERFAAITKSYYRGAHAIIIAFDLSSMESFKNVDHWLKESETNETAVKYLVGTKSDAEVVVDESLIKEFAASRGLSYFSTSAKKNQGVSNLFQSICYDLKKRVEEDKKISNSSLSTPSLPSFTRPFKLTSTTGNRGGCC